MKTHATPSNSELSTLAAYANLLLVDPGFVVLWYYFHLEDETFSLKKIKAIEALTKAPVNMMAIAENAKDICF